MRPRRTLFERISEVVVRHIGIISRIVVPLTTIFSLLPMAQFGYDWYQVSQIDVFLDAEMQSAPRGFDWVEWEESDGRITASYVFPNGPAAEAGLREEDQFFMLQFQQYFDKEVLLDAIMGVRPGDVRTFYVVRVDDYVEVEVTFSRYPTFLYPRSAALWSFALWGFTLGAFFHILGLFIAAPLAAHTKKARFELVLISVSSLWIGGNLLRLVLIEFLGPPAAGTSYDMIFQVLTFLGLFGWIGFPALLLHKVVREADPEVGRSGTRIHLAAYFTPLLLLAAVLITAVFGHLGPLTLEGLLIPILFYASCYIAAAALLVLLSHRGKKETATGILGEWGRTGSAAVFLIAVLVALAVVGIIPVLTTLSDVAAGWVIVSAQLLAVAPVTIFSLGTLRHGKVDEVVTRAFVYVLILGLIFFAFVGGLALLEPILENAGNSRIVIEGFYVVVLLILFERFARRIRLFASSFFSTERQRARRRISHYQAEMTDILDIELLAQRTINVVGQVFEVKSAILFLPTSGDDGKWVSGRYHPEPPYLTEQIFHTVWPQFLENPKIWARNPEVNEHQLSPDVSRLLVDHHAALAIPISREGKARGLMILSRKSRRRSVYNLEDLEQLRSLSGQLALAVERLILIERERQLAKESTSAHLVALRAQINPHFLFNALNTIMALIEERPAEAETVVEHLAAIFRHTLKTGSQPFVKLEEEFALVNRYLNIERARFGPRLKIDCTMDPGLSQVPVPAFSLQTIVENAIKHGLEKQRKGGLLRVRCSSMAGEGTRIEVYDSGRGIPSLFGTREPAEGIASFFGLGLTNVASRLEKHYNRNDLLRFESEPGVGTTVTLIIPFQDLAEHAGDGSFYAPGDAAAPPPAREPSSG